VCLPFQQSAAIFKAAVSAACMMCLSHATTLSPIAVLMLSLLLLLLLLLLCLFPHPAAMGWQVLRSRQQLHPQQRVVLQLPA
jgi:hypothetical protein